ncbi:hypothetical protein SMD44_07818 [Streptomyces alboflavus]|uniref:Uncharacterized protein n=1 Tax=Streptomyces alboflavus TaxID=67267 RepID=A0A1Z1WPE8_9ACTN|nr:hypothetical protein SMD44_07818 [Streptomyces alboflavus]
MRIMFVVCLSTVVLGIAYFTTVGALQR